MVPIEIFLLVIFIIAFLYSSVGHGGASGYLAIMAIAGISPALMKSSALLLNIFVAGIAFMSFYRAGFYRYKKACYVVESSFNRFSKTFQFLENRDAKLLDCLLRVIVFCFKSVLELDWICGGNCLSPQFSSKLHEQKFYKL